MEETLYLYLYQANKDNFFMYDNGIKLEQPKYLRSKLNSRYQKVSRIKSHIMYMLTRRQHIYFLTFTFSDDYINKCDRTKKDMIKSCLNDIEDSLYILNIDYGSKNEREHYHCVLATDFNFSDDTYFMLTYPCFSYIEKITIHDKSIERISKYINKLSNHAVKDTTKNSRIYYNFKGYDKIEDLPYKHLMQLLDKYLIYK